MASPNIIRTIISSLYIYIYIYSLSPYRKLWGFFKKCGLEGKKGPIWSLHMGFRTLTQSLPKGIRT